MTTAAIHPGEILGVAELGKLLGVNRARVSQLIAKPWFPKPAVRLAMGPVWHIADIERMASETGRTLDYDALAALPSSSLRGGSSSGTAGTAVQREP